MTKKVGKYTSPTTLTVDLIKYGQIDLNGNSFSRPAKENIVQLNNGQDFQYTGGLVMSTGTDYSTTATISTDSSFGGMASLSQETQELKDKITEVVTLGAALPTYDHRQRKYCTTVVFDKVQLPNGDSAENVSQNKWFDTFHEACDYITDHYKYKS